MPGRGAVPKDPAQRRRRNIEHRETLPGKPVAERPMPVGEWHAATVAWWSTWVGSPQAEKFEQTDWDTLADLVHLHDRYHRLVNDPEPKSLSLAIRLATELRLAQQLLGRTVADRQHLKWDVERAPTDAEPSDVDELDEWRKRAAGGAR